MFDRLQFLVLIYNLYLDGETWTELENYWLGQTLPRELGGLPDSVASLLRVEQPYPPVPTVLLDEV